MVPGSGIGYGWRLLFDASYLGFDSGERRRAQAPFRAFHARTNRLGVPVDLESILHDPLTWIIHHRGTENTEKSLSANVLRRIRQPIHVRIVN